MPFAATWMDPEIIILREVSHTKTNVIWHHLYLEPNFKKWYKKTYFIFLQNTRPFRYDLKGKWQVDYTVQVTNIFKGLDLTEYLKNYGWKFGTLYRRRWPNHPQEKEMQQGTMLVWGGLTNSWEKRSKRQRSKGKIYSSECRVPRTGRRDKKVF